MYPNNIELGEILQLQDDFYGAVNQRTFVCFTVLVNVYFNRVLIFSIEHHILKKKNNLLLDCTMHRLINILHFDKEL